MRELFAVTSKKGTIVLASKSLREALAVYYFLGLPENAISLIRVEEVKSNV